MPNVITYNALISACTKGEKPEQALELFYTLQGADVIPGVITFSAWISACGKGKMPEQALELFNSMNRKAWGLM